MDLQCADLLHNVYILVNGTCSLVIAMVVLAHCGLPQALLPTFVVASDATGAVLHSAQASGAV